VFTLVPFGCYETHLHNKNHGSIHNQVEARFCPQSYPFLFLGVPLSLEFAHFARLDLVLHLIPHLVPSAGLTELEGMKMFSLEKLKVHNRALAGVAGLAQLSAHWDKRHAWINSSALLRVWS
jgi:hypothetical protein